MHNQTKIITEIVKHLAGKHDQGTHAGENAKALLEALEEVKQGVKQPGKVAQIILEHKGALRGELWKAAKDKGLSDDQARKFIEQRMSKLLPEGTPLERTDIEAHARKYQAERPITTPKPKAATGTLESHMAYEKLMNDIERVKNDRTISNADIHSFENKLRNPKNASQRQWMEPRIKQARQNLIEDEKKLEVLKKKQREMEKAGQHTHPEFGQFVRQESAKTLGGHNVDYIAPSGAKVSISHFGGYSMQRVAPSSSLTFPGGFHYSVSGNGASDRIKRYAKEVFGIEHGLLSSGR